MEQRKCATSLLIEPMRLEHLPAVSVIERLSFSLPWPTAAYRRELEDNPDAAYFVARLRLPGDVGMEHEPVVGYAGIWTQYDEGHISTLAVHPDWRRRHIGEHLLLRLIDYALRRGLRLLTLEVRRSNLAAQRLYGKYGFVPVGCRRAYYPDNGEDALIMTTPPLSDPTWRKQLAACRVALGEGEHSARPNGR